MSKHLLVIAHRIPYPPNKGDKIRTCNMVRFLSRHFQVQVACMLDDVADQRYLKDLEVLTGQEVYHHLRSSLAMKFQALRALLTGRAFSQTCFYSPRLQRWIDHYLDEHPQAPVLCFCSSSAEYLYRSRHDFSSLQKRLLICDLIDVDSEKWAQYATSKRTLLAWLYSREARLLRPLETRIVRDFTRTFLVSEEEKQLLSDNAPLGRVEALANGVDLDYFQPEKLSENNDLGSGTRASEPNPHCLVFSGAMDYWPNVEGAVWFARHIFPRIRQADPEAVLYIAGRNPTDEVRSLQNLPGVEITGTVPDIRTYLAMAAICVVPLKIARGIQNKVLEAMAMAKPVVATSGAATGTRAVAGKDLVIADSDEQIADEIIALLGDPQRQRLLGAMARSYVEREHSWEAQLTQLYELINENFAHSRS